MKLELTISRVKEAIEKVESLYRLAPYTRQTSEEMNREFRQFISDMGKAPRWAIAQVEGYREARQRDVYKNLVFGGFLDGVFYSTHSKRPDYYRTRGIDPAEYGDDARVKNRGHYWDSPDGMEPYFISNAESV
ncbi:hypothetical protein Q669_29615 [Labrenzia sp. C1B10]|uniref:hypothetical protein n=1 Tax=unclassified Labrenzia TaxID=2648686 RepID=UPI0003B85987|nr:MULTISPECIES: hypothetical protein [unclassified Labrenzia]ERP95729.1 hypothetical protein Q669_29615 [Labrenzia sp. C1B10]ERS05795.1 hypothetical protein Q675_29180 [Labrenzia sp. C1B70]